MPFTDPMADGPTIQAAGQRGLAAGATLADTLDMVREFRAGDDATPVILMGYLNPILSYGPERFCADAAAAGVDGLIVVDLPTEEADLLLPHAAARARHHPPGRAHHRRRAPAASCSTAAPASSTTSASPASPAPAAPRPSIWPPPCRASAPSPTCRSPSASASAPRSRRPTRVRVADAAVVGSALIDTLPPAWTGKACRRGQVRTVRGGSAAAQIAAEPPADRAITASSRGPPDRTRRRACPQPGHR